MFLVTALKVTVKGEANVFWERMRQTKDVQGHSRTHTDYFRGNEQYFSLTYFLLGDGGSNICIAKSVPDQTRRYITVYVKRKYRIGMNKHPARSTIGADWSRRHFQSEPSRWETCNISAEQVRMQAGFNKYPFNFILPRNIPCSFEHKNGHIRYTTKAIIDRPWIFNHECKTAFTVVTSYDLNDHSEQCVSR